MCQIDVCTCTRLFETMPGVQPPSRSPATLPTANQPPPSRPAALVLFHEAATILSVPYYQPLPLPICSATDHPHLPSLPCRHPAAAHSSPLCLSPEYDDVTASTIRNVLHHPPLSTRRAYAGLSLFPFLFPLPSSSDARSDPSRRVRPWREYGNTGARRSLSKRMR
jgi:hypothetical protein